MTDLERIVEARESGDWSEIVNAVEAMADNDFDVDVQRPADRVEGGMSEDEAIESFARDVKDCLPCWRELEADELVIWERRIRRLAERAL
ncbi:MAG: hypothetical protein BPHS0_28 [Phage 5P_3]|nr:MAG: hypothetical protein BPHS0_28 [Phage 5P_3]